MVDGTWGGNVYLLLDDDGLALVDAALPGNAGKVLRYIRSLGRDPADLRYVVITHAHPDHTGTIPSLLRHASAKVAIHREDTRGDGRLRAPLALLPRPAHYDPLESTLLA